MEQLIQEEILDSLPLGVLICNEEFNVLAWNYAIEALTGNKRDDIIGKNLFENCMIFNENGLDKILANLIKTDIPLQLIDFKIGYSSTKNSQMYVCINAKKLLNSTNGCKCLILTIEDTTGRRNKICSLEETVGRYRLLVENTQTGMLYIDTKGNIIELNKAIVDLLGSPSYEATKSINLLNFKPIVDAGISSDILECISTEKKVRRERYYTSNWGKHLFMKYTLVPIKDINGKLIGILGSIEDYSDFKQKQDKVLRDSVELETELSLYRRKLEKLLKEHNTGMESAEKIEKLLSYYQSLLDSFIGMMSQDLKSSMLSLSAITEQLSQFGSLLDSDVLFMKHKQLNNTAIYLASILEKLFILSDYHTCLLNEENGSNELRLVRK